MTTPYWTEFEPGRRFLGRLPEGADLLRTVEEICQAVSIQMASFSIVGMASSVTLGCYDQKQQVFITDTMHGNFEIISCSGNVSVKNAKPFAGAWGVFTKENGEIMGGRIFSNTILFAGEIDLQELNGQTLVRAYDPATGLMLWQWR